MHGRWERRAHMPETTKQTMFANILCLRLANVKKKRLKWKECQSWRCSGSAVGSPLHSDDIHKHFRKCDEAFMRFVFDWPDLVAGCLSIVKSNKKKMCSSAFQRWSFVSRLTRHWWHIKNASITVIKNVYQSVCCCNLVLLMHHIMLLLLRTVELVRIFTDLCLFYDA